MLPLSRLLITGRITDCTPKFVISEILFFHKSHTIRDVLKQDVAVVSDPPTYEELEDIASFINPYEEWDVKKLLQAWNFIKSFMCKRISVKWQLKNVGLQTNNTPYSLNASMLYRICLEWGIPTTNKNTVEDIITMIKIAILTPKSIRTIVCQNVRNNYDDSKNEEKLINKLVKFKQKYNNMNVRTPGTNAEAIAISAILYSKDLTYSSYPIIDFYSKKICKVYHDERLKKIHRKNKDILDLRCTFNPVFPVTYYARSTLEKLYRGFGFVGSVPNIDMYLNLHLNYTIDNFYRGWQEKLKRDTSAIMMEELDGRKDIICFGNYITGFIPYVVEELIQLYSIKNNFSHPDIMDEELEPRMVTTLQNISESLSPELNSILKRIKMIDIQLDNTTRNIVNWYISLTEENKTYVDGLLKGLLELGMYMRGWKGEDDPYPVKRRPYTEDTDGLVTIAYWPVVDEYKNEIGKLVLDLPLYRYSYGSWKRSRDKKDGITIYERLSKVKSNKDIYACIRMSSNWFICTAYKYMVLFGMPPPFNLQDADHIT